MNRLRENVGKNQAATWRLGAAFVLSGQPDICRQLTSGLKATVSGYCEMGGTFGSDLRDEAMILETLVLLGEEQKAFTLLREMADKINKGYWLNTQTASWCLSSAAFFADKYFGKGKELSFALTVNGKQNNLRSSMPFLKVPVEATSGRVITAITENRGTVPVFVRLVARGIPLNPDTTSASDNLKLEVACFNSSGQPVNPVQLQQGEDLKMVVKVTHPGTRSDYEEMVLSTVFPSGWEIMNRRVNDLPGSSPVVFDYQDIRDDRIYTYFDLPRNGTKTFTFYLNASYSGKFFQAPVSCEAMYDNTIHARVRGQWINIKPLN